MSSKMQQKKQLELAWKIAHVLPLTPMEAQVLPQVVIALQYANQLQHLLQHLLLQQVIEKDKYWSNYSH